MANRNESGRFSQNPVLSISRSTFNRNSSIKTTFNVGDLIPFYVDEVLPGDTFSIDTSKVVRMQTPLTPIMDNIYLDTYYFFVPNRLVWKHWPNLMFENTESAWIPESVYSVPQVTAPVGGWNVGTIADYMGIPTGVAGISVNAMPFRAYALICNEWFRDQNLQDPLFISLEDATLSGSNEGNYITDCQLGGKPFVAGKLHDYFTSALPSPQKGPDVTIPLLGGNIPVNSLEDYVPNPTSQSPFVVASTGGNFGETGRFIGTNPFPGVKNKFAQLRGFDTTPGPQPPLQDSFAPANLWAVTSDVAYASINSLRLAFQTQKFFEKLARGGSRYIESIKSMFNVTNPDYRLQRPEYLGGNRIPITINQVIQQSASSDSSPQGTTTGQSLTTDVHSDFTKSFTEHGYIIGLMVARYNHTYQQGLSKMWTRKAALDFYFPVFANIGEQPIYNREIYCQGQDVDGEVFGYQEAWADYRYRPNICTGEMRSSFAQSLDVWHLADDYGKLPSLSPGWIREDKTNLDRCLAVHSSVSNQFFADIYVKNKTTRPMPLYSIPGLIDHH
ncbi:major capsid protein [Gokushovirinae sp.]|nr:major capsid protein [Gokushovirinae sp.]